VEDLRALAQRRVPRLFYDYVDSGSWSEETYRRNSRDLACLNFRQRVGCDVGDIRTDTTLLGAPVAMPVGLAPAGLAGMVHPDGEIHAARAAAKFGVPYVLSTVSICSIEELAAQSSAPFWFQLYVMRDREFVERLIERADGARCPALVLTMDLPVQGQRHKDIRNGLSVPPRVTLRTLMSMASHPRWCLGMTQTPRRTFGNIVGHAKGVSDTLGFSEWVSRQFDRTVTWDDVRWIRALWRGKLVVKGIMDPRDALHAIEAGADAIVVSNHGGRQLDGAPSSISALSAIVRAVDSTVEVFFDGGVRSGQDVLRALSLGADSAWIGRAYMYGLGAQGEAGVSRCLGILHNELMSTMALCGLTRVDEASPDVLINP
jgi:L-lactate dehydrogenase (cytochrome)